MNVFTYGSLTFEKVMYAVVQLEYESQAAILEDFARLQVADASYPGLVEAPGARVEGRLYTGLIRKSMLLLDLFEGNYYDRITVLVQRSEDGKLVEAETYLFKEEYRHLLTDHDWDPDTFARQHMDRFLESYQGFWWIGVELEEE